MLNGNTKQPNLNESTISDKKKNEITLQAFKGIEQMTVSNKIYCFYTNTILLIYVGHQN